MTDVAMTKSNMAASQTVVRVSRNIEASGRSRSQPAYLQLCYWFELLLTV